MTQHMATHLWQPLLTRSLGEGAEPYLNITWWLSHPLVMVVTVLVLLVTAQGILGLVSKVIKQLLLLIVKSPYLLLQWLLAKSSQSLNLPTMALKEPKLDRKSGKEEKLHERLLISLNQLETAQKEQDRVLKELKNMLAENQTQSLPLKPDSSSSSQTQPNPPAADR